MNIQSSIRSRPTGVTVAVAILVVTSLMGIAKLIVRGAFAYPQMVSLAIYVWGFLLAWLVFRGKNWSRWVYLVLIAVAVLDFLFSADEIQRLSARPAIAIGWFCLQSLLSPVAVVLLFLPASNEWFRQQRNAA